MTPGGARALPTGPMSAAPDHHSQIIISRMNRWMTRAIMTLRTRKSCAARQSSRGARHPWLLFPSLLFFRQKADGKPVDQFVANPDIDIKFCLDWANENWTRRWDGQENEILIAQQHSPEDDIRFWKDASRYFGDPRYIRIDGRPLFLVYHAALFPDMSATLWRWRKWCVEHEEIIPFCHGAKLFQRGSSRIRF